VSPEPEPENPSTEPLEPPIEETAPEPTPEPQPEPTTEAEEVTAAVEDVLSDGKLSAADAEAVMDALNADGRSYGGRSRCSYLKRFVC
jgi:outer membrane biosynthesis protein TonB